MNYQFDLAGSRTKNRFKAELLWGLDKIFTQYKTDKDFNIVFDYVCDIEVHIKNKYEFYQVKTTSNKPYSISKICETQKKQNSNELKNSILGKLYLLRTNDLNSGKNKSKLAIVSNQKMNEDTISTASVSELYFCDLTESDKNKIKTKLQVEFNTKADIDIDNISFIKTDIPLDNPDEILIGKLVNFFEEVMNEELHKPKALFNVLRSEIEEKACYEHKCNTYNEVMNYKSISGFRVEEILKKYKQVNENIFNLCIIEIDKNITEFQKKTTAKASLRKMWEQLKSNMYYLEMEKEVYNNLINEELCGSIMDIAQLFVVNNHKIFPIEWTIIDREIFVIIVLKKLEEGIYE